MIALTIDDVVMYVQQGMIHGEMQGMGISDKPKTREEIRKHPFFKKFIQTKVDSMVTYQGPQLLDQIGDHKISSILDIGCGLGLCSLSLYNAMNPKPTLYVCDGGTKLSGDEATYLSTFTEGNNLVSNMSTTYNLLMRNGVDQKDVNVIGPDIKNISNLNKIDLVISNVSWCYHYPPEVYWAGVKQCMHPDSILRVDIRVGPYEDPHPEYIEFFKEYFLSVKILGTSGTPLRPDKTMHILAKYPRVS